MNATFDMIDKLTRLGALLTREAEARKNGARTDLTNAQFHTCLNRYREHITDFQRIDESRP